MSELHGPQRPVAAGRKIRVLVVDDSPLARKLICAALNATGDFEIAGWAEDGQAAREQIAVLKPDVVTLDIAMPRVDGMTFLRQSQGAQWVPAVVVSAMTGRGCRTAMEALRAGAVEVIGKPVDRAAFEEFQSLLPAKVRAAYASQAVATRKSQGAGGAVSALHLPPPAVIAIGASTGGTQAVESILREAPEDAPGMVIAQHIPAKFSAMFAERLSQVCRIAVKEAEDGDRVRPGSALIAPGDQHMVLRKRAAGFEVTLNQGPRVSFQRPSVDVLFHSVAKVAAESALGVLLTGMGNDGAAGLLEMHRAGAVTLVQDEATCTVFGMPREAIRLGGVDHVLPLHEIAAVLGNLRTPRPGAPP